MSQLFIAAMLLTSYSQIIKKWIYSFRKKKVFFKNAFEFWSRLSSYILVLCSLSLFIVLKTELYLTLYSFSWELPVFLYYIST